MISFGTCNNSAKGAKMIMMIQNSIIALCTNQTGMSNTTHLAPAIADQRILHNLPPAGLCECTLHSAKMALTLAAMRLGCNKTKNSTTTHTITNRVLSAVDACANVIVVSYCFLQRRHQTRQGTQFQPIHQWHFDKTPSVVRWIPRRPHAFRGWLLLLLLLLLLLPFKVCCWRCPFYTTTAFC